MTRMNPKVTQTAYPENPRYNPFLDSLIFFLKVSLSCAVVAVLISLMYTNLQVSESDWWYGPFLMSFIHACVYYPVGYLLFNMYDADYFPNFKVPRIRTVPRQTMDWAITGVIKGELIGVAMNYFFFGVAFHVGGMKYDSESSSEIKYVDIVELFLWYMFAILWADVSFYATHYCFHTSGWVYRVIHKEHHRFQYQVGWSAEVKTLTESIIVSITDLLPHLVFPRVHLVHMLAWIIVGVVYNIEAHSGYSLFFIKRYGFHDWHHVSNKGNYGIAVYLDHLFKTSTDWLTWIQSHAKRV